MPQRSVSEISLKQIIFLLVVFISSGLFVMNNLFAQETNKKEGKDTIVSQKPINQSLLRGFHADIIVPSRMQTPPNSFYDFLQQSSTSTPTSLSWQFQQQVDVVSPWKQEVEKLNENRALKIILQSVQAGATAYILYEHINRYGLK